MSHQPRTSLGQGGHCQPAGLVPALGVPLGRSCSPGELRPQNKPSALSRSSCGFPSRPCGWVALSPCHSLPLGWLCRHIPVSPDCLWITARHDEHYPLYQVQQLCYASHHLWDQRDLLRDTGNAVWMQEGLLRCPRQLLPSPVLGLREASAFLGSPSTAVPGTMCEIPVPESPSQGSARAAELSCLPREELANPSPS